VITASLETPKRELMKYAREYPYHGIALSLEDTPCMFVFSDNYDDMKDCIIIVFMYICEMEVKNGY